MRSEIVIHLVLFNVQDANARHGTTTPGYDETPINMASRGSPSAACVDGESPVEWECQAEGSGRGTDIACHRGRELQC